jgi:hypothetical protein
MKKTFIKTIITSMIIALFATSFFQSSASAASATVSNSQNVIVKNEIKFEKVEKSETQAVSTQSLPPRQSPKDPFWRWVSIVVAGFVGVAMAEVFVQNAINNGIDAACKKWSSNSGVKKACSIFQD